MALFHSIIPQQKDHDSIVEYRYALLRSHLALILGFICILYLVVDTVTGVYIFYIPQLVGLSFAAIILYLNKYNKPHLASIVLMVIINILVFLFTGGDSPERGVFFYYIISAAFGVILFYPNKKVTAMVFVLLSIALALVALLGNISILPEPEQTKQTETLNFLINFVIGIWVTTLIILFTINRYSESENILKKKNDELIKTNEELDKFIYSASHDMRAPLSSFSGLLKLARNSDDPNEITQFYGLMDRRIDTMEGFIKEITDYARNQRTELELSTFNLKSMLDDLKDMFDILAEPNDVCIKIQVKDDIEIRSDLRRLNVVLSNLLNNSIRYYDPYKEGRFVQVSGSTSDDKLHLAVEDNGSGILDQYSDKIFDMFFRATDRSEGSGLGLYIVKETLDKMGGRITHTSNGAGTKFNIEVPLALDNK